MIIHDLQQGTAEWHQFRARHFNASDAAAMMGVSPYETRTQLLKRLYLGIDKETSAFVQERLYDKGHEFESLARPLAEKIIGGELYPVIGSSEKNEKFAASFDGLTMAEDIGFEHKKLNAAISSCSNVCDLPLFYLIQLEHQLLVSDKTKKTLFMASDWFGETLIDKREFWYESDKKLRQQIIDGWEQFEKDLANYEHSESETPVVGRAPETLPALLVEMRGEVTQSNLGEFKEFALAVLDDIKTELETDEDFANADKTAKWCNDVEQRLRAAKDHALSQTKSIDDTFRMIDAIIEETRQKRLTLEKMVKQKKETIRAGKVAATHNSFAKHIEELNAQIEADPNIDRPVIDLGRAILKPDFGASIKGLKSLSSIQNVLDTMLAQEKINANNLFKDYQAKLNIYKKEAHQHEALFVDLNELIKKPVDDFVLTIKNRIEKYLERKAQTVIPEKKVTAIVDGIVKDSLYQLKKMREMDSENSITAFMVTRDYGENTELIHAVLIDFSSFLSWRENVRKSQQ